MTTLNSQRRIAAQLLKIGRNRVWIDPERIEDVEAAMTRDEIRKLLHEGAIKSLPQAGVSRGRARIIHLKKKKVAVADQEAELEQVTRECRRRKLGWARFEL